MDRRPRPAAQAQPPARRRRGRLGQVQGPLLRLRRGADQAPGDRREDHRAGHPQGVVDARVARRVRPRGGQGRPQLDPLPDAGAGVRRQAHRRPQDRPRRVGVGRQAGQAPDPLRHLDDRRQRRGGGRARLRRAGRHLRLRLLLHAALRRLRGGAPLLQDVAGVLRPVRAAGRAAVLRGGRPGDLLPRPPRSLDAGAGARLGGGHDLPTEGRRARREVGAGRRQQGRAGDPGDGPVAEPLAAPDGRAGRRGQRQDAQGPHRQAGPRQLVHAAPEPVRRPRRGVRRVLDVELRGGGAVDRAGDHPAGRLPRPRGGGGRVGARRGRHERPRGGEPQPPGPRAHRGAAPPRGGGAGRGRGAPPGRGRRAGSGAGARRGAPPRGGAGPRGARRPRGRRRGPPPRGGRGDALGGQAVPRDAVRPEAPRGRLVHGRRRPQRVEAAGRRAGVRQQRGEGRGLRRQVDDQRGQRRVQEHDLPHGPVRPRRGQLPGADPDRDRRRPRQRRARGVPPHRQAPDAAQGRAGSRRGRPRRGGRAADGPSAGRLVDRGRGRAGGRDRLQRRRLDGQRQLRPDPGHRLPPARRGPRHPRGRRRGRRHVEGHGVRAVGQQRDRDGCADRVQRGHRRGRRRLAPEQRRPPARRRGR